PPAACPADPRLLGLAGRKRRHLVVRAAGHQDANAARRQAGCAQAGDGPLGRGSLRENSDRRSHHQVSFSSSGRSFGAPAPPSVACGPAPHSVEPRCALQEFHDERQEACQAGADSRSNGSTRRSERTSRNRVILIEQKCSGFTERTRRQLTVGAVTITVLAAGVAPRRARWLDPWASSVSATWDDPCPCTSSSTTCRGSCT